MEYTTHNNEAIDTAGLTPQGVIETNKKELVSLFGNPIGQNFVVKFSDGNRALIYPSSADHWYVEGSAKQSHTNLQITLDLYREQADEKFADPVSKAMESAFDIMANVKATKGDDYATLLEISLLARKSLDLINSLSGAAIATGALPDIAGVALRSAASHITARTIILSARLGKIDTDKHSAGELMDWTERLLKAEGDGVKGLLSELEKDDDA